MEEQTVTYDKNLNEVNFKNLENNDGAVILRGDSTNGTTNSKQEKGTIRRTGHDDRGIDESKKSNSRRQRKTG